MRPTDNMPLIVAKDLVKSYRLYGSPTERVLDVLGLLRRREGRFREHRALDGISFEIHKGEKVGIIGRNGAGKSTLLKLITRTIEPTSGYLEVRAPTQALLQIGTGFHPDFTGRDNVVSYLAQLGISGTEAEGLTREVIEFAEIEEYIDQPVKTYSTGMSARLMFAASTVMSPDVLVIDEVLGVGDAYFAHKSYERIRSLCAENGSTLLLVSHDIYSAAQICERMIWIDRGRVKHDGPSKETINLYEASIKDQEEQRLRRKATLAPTFGATSTGHPGRSALVEFRAAKGNAFSGSLTFYSISLEDGSQPLASIDPVRARSASSILSTTGSSLEIVFEASNWLTADEAGRNDVVVLASYGQPYHKGLLRAHYAPSVQAPSLNIVVESATDQEVRAVVFDSDSRAFDAGTIALKAGERTPWQVTLSTDKLPRFDQLVSAGERHGSGAVRITGVDILDADGNSTRTLVTGAACEFVIDYVVNDPQKASSCEIIIAAFRGGVLDASHAFQSNLDLSRFTRLRARISRLVLGSGVYHATLMIAANGYFASDPKQAFSINPAVYDVLARSVEFQVRTSDPAYSTTVAIQDSVWIMESSLTTNMESVKSNDAVIRL